MTLIHMIVAAIVVPLTWLLVYMVWVPTPPITWTGARFIPPSVEAGQTVLIQRDFVVTEEVLVMVDRQFVKRDNGHIIVVEIPGIQHKYEVGKYEQYRPYKIPCELTPGRWSLENIMTYRDILGRERTIRPPAIEVLVTKECDQ